jgi:hypothetical protein
VRRHIVYGKECTESNLGDLHAGLEGCARRWISPG